MVWQTVCEAVLGTCSCSHWNVILKALVDWSQSPRQSRESQFPRVAAHLTAEKL